jgi:uncharacterized membrane protein
MTVSAAKLGAILAMALATFATRYAGLLLLKGVTIKGRLKAALDAVPPAILTAVIAPTMLTTGYPEAIASIITLAAAMLRLPLLMVVVIGVASVVVLRMILA